MSKLEWERSGEVIRLKSRTHVCTDPFDVILGYARGRRVLNVGAAGGVYGYLPGNRSVWLHERLRTVARELVGLDVDREAVEYAARHGCHIELGDCETWRSDTPFDVIVLSDVLEHLDGPVHALKNLVRSLGERGKIIVTTPNASAGNVVLRGIFRRSPNVYHDHVSCYLPEHLEVAARRAGLLATELYFFDHVDRRSRSLWVKSMVFRGWSMIAPRMASSILMVLEHEHEHQRA